MPRAGGFLFVWESWAPRKWGRFKLPPRPARFEITPRTSNRHPCGNPSWLTAFQTQGRILAVEAYLGPSAGPKVRARMEALLNSVEVAPRARS